MRVNFSTHVVNKSVEACSITIGPLLGSIINVERTTSIFINSISELLPRRIGFELNDMQTEYRKKNHCGSSIFQK